VRKLHHLWSAKRSPARRPWDEGPVPVRRDPEPRPTSGEFTGRIVDWDAVTQRGRIRAGAWLYHFALPYWSGELPVPLGVEVTFQATAAGEARDLRWPTAAPAVVGGFDEPGEIATLDAPRPTCSSPCTNRRSDTSDPANPAGWVPAHR
jgi:hypothetical protein